MDKNDSMERRFSLNITHLPNPIAESTCVNMNGSTGKNTISGTKSSAGEFRWGDSPISTKNRSNSSICLNSTNAVYKGRSTATSPIRARMNLSKIDPRIYADVQSRGLASRIVQYHENSSRLNRSMSASNLYNKSGKSSLTQLQKSVLPYRATQQNVTMTRIVTPKKSVFYGNTLSSLLRSNSVISVQKSDEELSCENRPILHPPPTENDLAPTRSVLDVLKEISRKRINSDESDGMNDANKKYCNRDCNGAQNDAPTSCTDPRNMVSMQGDVVTETMHAAGQQNYKRQREQTVAPQQQHHQSKIFAHISNCCATNGSALASTRSPINTQHSPEQITKKRLCSYNNDITSSLSSSLIHANKRKFYEQQRTATHQHSPPSLFEEYEAQKSKIQRQQSDLYIQRMTKSFTCNTPITPLPNTPLNANTTNILLASGDTNKTGLPTEPTAAVKKTNSAPPHLNNIVPNKPQKPKITLFNRNYDEPTSWDQIKGTDKKLVEIDNDSDNGECADIQFVKPKKSSAIVNTKNPLIERTQKSKLAMMLSGLRGEIYHGEEDGEDVVDKTSNITLTTDPTTPTTATNVVYKALTENSSSATASKTDAVPSTPAEILTTPSQTITTSTTVGSFKLTATTSSISNSVAATVSSPSTVPSVASTKQSSPLVGIKLTPQNKVLKDSGDTKSSAPTFNFGETTTTSVVAGTIATGVGKVPQLQGFSFGLPTKNTPSTATSAITTLATNAATATVATTTATVTTASVGGFKFESPIKSTSTTTSVTPISKTSAAAPTGGGFGNSIASTLGNASTDTPKSLFAFGGAAATNTTATVATTDTTATAFKGTFNIAGTVAATTSTTSAPIFDAPSSTGNFTLSAAFSNNSTTKTASVANTEKAIAPLPQTKNLFGGGTSSNAFAAPPTPSSNMFAFGGLTSSENPVSTAISTNALMSGGILGKSNLAASSTVTTTNLFSFGGDKTATLATANTAPATATFAFGSANTQNETAPVITITTVPSTTSINTDKPTFSFGSSGTSVAGAPTVTPSANPFSSNGNLFSFGGNSTSSEKSVFGSNAAATNNTQAAIAAAPQSGSLSFGTIAAAQKPNTPFGAASTTTNTPVSTPLFGAQVKATATATHFPFGGGSNVTKPSDPTSSLVNSSAAPTGGFSFGSISNANANNTTGTTNIFGAASSTISNNQPSSSNTNIVKPSFNFSGASTNTADTNKSIFGGLGENVNSNNTFGAFSAAANVNQQNKTFSFTGIGSSTVTNNTATQNPFTTPAAKPATSAGGFSFANTATNAATNNSAVASSAPFAFGGSTNTSAVASNTTSPFSFGGAGSGAPPNKTFSFGSNSSSNNSSAATVVNAGSIFGGSMQKGVATSGNPQQNSVQSFNFSAGTSAAAPTPVATNIFAPPAVAGAGNTGGPGGPGSRPIRRATRRLQKT